MAVAKAEQTHKLSKHLDVKLHSVRERIEQQKIDVRRVATEDNHADIFTKSLGHVPFQYHANNIGVEKVDDFLVDSLSSLPLASDNAPET
jgi:hypothetical protein